MTVAMAGDLAAIGPDSDEIAAARRALSGRIVATPVLELSHERFAQRLPDAASIAMKLELFQEAGSFKARGALLSIDALSDDERAAGVVTASAGNHARAVSWAARAANVSAHIVMPAGVDPVRISACEALGARVDLAPDVTQVFAQMEHIAQSQGRVVVHPFEGRCLTLGTATCGAEFVEAVPDMEIAIIPVGGGGLISGMSRAIRLANPNCPVIGVEPEGADSMRQSFESGAPVRLEAVRTIADSLGAPMAMPYSFGVARAHVDRIITVSDDALRDAMRLMNAATQLMVEPACAATLAAVCGPLAGLCAGRRVGIIACGSNMSPARYNDLAADGGTG